MQVRRSQTLGIVLGIVMKLLSQEIAIAVGEGGKVAEDDLNPNPKSQPVDASRLLSFNDD